MDVYNGFMTWAWTSGWWIVILAAPALLAAVMVLPIVIWPKLLWR